MQAKNNISQNTFQKYTGEAALLLMTIIWGGTFVIVKESLHDASPMLFVSLRFAIASFVLIPVVIKRKDKLNKSIILHGLFLGLLLFLGFSFQTAGLGLTTATKSAFITGALVVMIPGFQIIIEKKPPTVGALIGTILVFIGILFLSSGGSSVFTFLNELGSSFGLGDALTLICAVFFAIHVIYIGMFSKKFELWPLLFVQLASVAVFSFIAATFFSATGIEPIHLEITHYLIFGVLYNALLATLFNIALQMKYQKIVTATKAGIIYSFEPIFAAIFAFFVLNEKISNFGLIGSILIFSGLIVSEVYENLVKKFGGQIAESGDIG